MSTSRRYFVDADGDLRPPVHTGGAFCGRPVPRRSFCPHRGCLLWTSGAGRELLSTKKAISVEGNGLWVVCCPGTGAAGATELSELSGKSDYHSNCSLTGKRPNIPPVWMKRMFFAPTKAPPSFSSLYTPYIALPV